MKTKQSGVSAGLSKNLIMNNVAKTPFRGVSAGLSKNLIMNNVAKKLNITVFILVSMVTNWVYAECPKLDRTFFEKDYVSVGTTYYRFRGAIIGGVNWQNDHTTRDTARFTEGQIGCLRLTYVYAAQPFNSYYYDINIVRENLLIDTPYTRMVCQYSAPITTGTSASPTIKITTGPTQNQGFILTSAFWIPPTVTRNLTSNVPEVVSECNPKISGPLRASCDFKSEVPYVVNNAPIPNNPVKNGN